MEKIGIFYGSSTGNTEEVANMLQKAFGGEATLHNVADTEPEQLNQYKNIIIGSSTWGVGDLQDDMYSFAEALPSLSLDGKRIALFGLGDQSVYSDTYCDALGILNEALENTGCERVGNHVDNDDYDYSASRAEQNDELVGLALDQDSQPELTEERIAEWVKELKEAFY